MFDIHIKAYRRDRNNTNVGRICINFADLEQYRPLRLPGGTADLRAVHGAIEDKEVARIR